MAKATIVDVARQAGVSIKTVSRVINREANGLKRLRGSTRQLAFFVPLKMTSIWLKR